MLFQMLTGLTSKVFLGGDYAEAGVSSAAAVASADTSDASFNNQNNAAVISRLLLDTDEGMLLHHNIYSFNFHYSSLYF